MGHNGCLLVLSLKKMAPSFSFFLFLLFFFFFFFFFFCEKQTYTQGSGKDVFTQNTLQLHSKIIVTFKGGCSKLYNTQHTLLSNMRQYPFFFLRNKHTHIIEREMNSNTKTHYNSTKKSCIVTFKGEWGKLFYTQLKLTCLNCESLIGLGPCLDYTK